MTPPQTPKPASPPDTEDPPALSKSEFHLVLAALVMAMILASLDQSIVNTALPRIVGDLGGLEHISWVVTAFMLGSTVSTPIYGKLSDMYGRRRIFVASITILLVASILCGLAQDMLQLVVFRGLQGLGGGGLLILSQSVIADLVSPRERGRYLGLFTGAMVVSSIAGPLVGGALTDALSWRWVFYVNLPVGGAALALIVAGLRVEARKAKRHEIDIVGALLLSASVICVLLLLSWGGSTIGWLSWEAAGLATFASIGLALFYRWEQRTPEPLVDFDLLRTPGLLPAAMASCTISFAMMGTAVFLPLYFQLVLGLDPTRAGLMLTPQVGATLVSSIAFGHISSRYGRPKITLVGGAILNIVGLIGLAVLALTRGGVPGFILVLTVLGLGQGVAMPSATLIVQAVAGPQKLGMATAAIAFIRNIGASTGIAVSGGVMAIVLARRLAGSPLGGAAPIRGGLEAIGRLPEPLRSAMVDAYRVSIMATFVTSLAVMLLALVVAAKVQGEPLRDRA